MKADIHPTFFSDARVTCVCGAVHVTGSSKKELSVDICSECHPFYTGKQKLIDTEGRIERFKKRYANVKK